MFRMPWIMTQKQISQKAFLAKCYYRKRGGMAPMLPSPSVVEEPDIYIYIYIYIYQVLDRTKLHSWNFCNVKLCQLYTLKISEPKTKSTGNSNIFFLSALKIPHFFLLTFENSAFYFFGTPRDFILSNPSPQPSVCFFFLERPNVRENTQNKLETFFATSCKSHISNVENENSG